MATKQEEAMDKIVVILSELDGDLLGDLYYAIRKFYGDV